MNVYSPSELYLKDTKNFFESLPSLVERLTREPDFLSFARNYRNNSGDSLLHILAYQEFQFKVYSSEFIESRPLLVTLVKLLVDGDVVPLNSLSQSPLHQDGIAMADILMEASEKFFCKDGFGHTPIDLAVLKGNRIKFVLLSSRGFVPSPHIMESAPEWASLFSGKRTRAKEKVANSFWDELFPYNNQYLRHNPNADLAIKIREILFPLLSPKKAQQIAVE
jgi:hypothetical protein